MPFPPLHTLNGGAGIWDELACLIVPATAIMGVALALLRQGPADPDGESPPADHEDPAPNEPQVGAADRAR